jgi:cell division protein ZapA
MNKTVNVEIFGHTYRLKGVRDAEALKRLAAYVDRKMNLVADQARTTDTVKIAILAALNIADEYFLNLQRPGEEGERMLEDRLEELEQKLGNCLQGVGEKG